MQKIYPFKFLDAYQREDADFFFGRNDEIEALYKMIFQTKILLIYGTSGTGKTSLIQCGLANKFQTYDWLALNIRRGKNMLASLDKVLCSESDEMFTHMESEAPLLKDLSKKIEAVYRASFKPLYLIFDQFEELYILGSKTEQAQFIQTIKEILPVEQPVKIIISIREEYLGCLYEFERAVAELLRKKLRVEPMNSDKVKTVIEGVGSLPQSNVSLQPGEEDAIARGIFDIILGKEKALSIQLPYLQVFLDKLYLQITQDKKRQADATFTLAALAEMGDIGDVLRNFLDEQVLLTAQKLGQTPENIWRILSPFVTLEGTKEPLSEQDLCNRLPTADPALITATLQTFVNSRILRYTENEQLYEIAHDSLAKQIHAKRSDEEIAILEVQRLIKSQTALKAEAREFFTERQLHFIEPYLGKFKPAVEEQDWIAKSRAHMQAQKEAEKRRQAEELEKTRRRLLKSRLMFAAAVLALLVAGYFGSNADRQKKAVKLALEETEKAKLQADSALHKANKLINAFYFYEDRFALAFKEDKFYFIDQNGDEVTKLNKWDKAEQFEWSGFAKVKKEENEKLMDYLLDTLGNIYPVAFDIKDLNEKITALDLSEKELTDIPVEVFRHTSLKVLLLSVNQLGSLPAAIGELKNLTSLDLSYNELGSLPAAIGELKNLTSLDLSINRLGSLPAAIGDLKNLTSLDLSDNRLGSLPAAIGELKNLTSLDLSINRLGSLPAAIGELKNLTSLDLSGTRLGSLPAAIGELKNLTSLYLSDNRLGSLPAAIGELKNLTSLDLSATLLGSLPAAIGELKNLTSLDLRGNQLGSLPAAIGELKNLTSLYLSINRLGSLPAAIGELKNLTSLDLSDNRLGSLPAAIGELKNLTSLYLSINRLGSLPAAIGELKNLTSLDLSSNELGSLPAAIGELKNLTSLDLSGNELGSLPAAIGELKNLTDLDLSGTRLGSLPAAIGELKNLTDLDLSGTRLGSLPAAIGELKNLTSLDLSSNELGSLPAAIGELKNLTDLDLSGTRLGSLPAAIGELKNLTSLDLSFNRLGSLPAAIGELKNLTTLNLEVNPISKTEQEKIRQLLSKCEVTF